MAHSLATTAATLLACALAAAHGAAAYMNVYGNCVASTNAMFTLPDVNLTALNPFLTTDPYYTALAAAGCPSDRDAGTVCSDKPAIGSGMTQLFPNYFLGLTDRGPNQDCETLAATDATKYAGAAGKVGKGFPVPRFAPTIVHFQRNTTSSSIVLRKTVPLLGKDGKPISGVSNTMADDTPYGPGCAGDPLPYDPSGLDTEDIGFVRNTDYVVLVDEYSPSVVVANFKTGAVAGRHVPKKLGPVLAAANYDIVADIPDIYTYRRKNRGFEAVVVDPFGRFAIAILQSPMVGEDESKTMDNLIVRCAYFEMGVKNGVPTLSYNKSFVLEVSAPPAWNNKANKAMDISVSSAEFRSRFEFITMERAKNQVKLFKVDYRFATNIDKTKYADNLDLEKGTNGNLLAQQLGVRPARKVLIWDSAKDVPGGTADFSGSVKLEGFAIDPFVTGKLWLTNENDFGLDNNGPVKLQEISLGRAPSGATVCAMPEHPPAPVVNMVPTRKLRLRNPRTLRISDVPGAGAAENLDVNEATKLAYVANDDSGSIDMYDVSKMMPRAVKSYKVNVPYKPTSVSVCESRGLVAASLTNDADEAAPGRVLVMDRNLTVLRLVMRKECVLPDDVKWTADCKFLVAACEGEGADVPGGVMVADYRGPGGMWYRGVRFASFAPYDGLVNILIQNGVRLVESMKPSVDLEPEYVATVGHHAYVTVQENNAIAVVDLAEAAITELKPLGFINRFKPGFSLDTSDKDGRVNLRNYRYLYGMPQPDTIKTYVAADGKTYLIYANEGDAKDSEEYRGKDLTDSEELGRKAIPRLAYLTSVQNLLGRIKFSSKMGYNMTSNTQEALYHFGARSFSIMAMDGTIVFDSGNWFARIMRRYYTKIFNANNFDDDDLSKSMQNLFDSRSDDKGMEPESLDVMTTGKGDTFVFIGFERGSTIVVFNVTTPTRPTFVFSANNNPTAMPIKDMFAMGKQGDMDPEGLFASMKLKKLFVSGAVSNTLTMYDMVMV